MNNCTCCKFVKIILACIVLFLLAFIITLSNNITKLELFSGTIPALILAFFAWIQLQNIQRTARGDFLIRIDDHFYDEKSRNANELIYWLDRKSKAKCAPHKQRDPHCRDCENAVIRDMKNKLSLIWYSHKDEDMKTIQYFIIFRAFRNAIIFGEYWLYF